MIRGHGGVCRFKDTDEKEMDSCNFGWEPWACTVSNTYLLECTYPLPISVSDDEVFFFNVEFDPAYVYPSNYSTDVACHENFTPVEPLHSQFFGGASLYYVRSDGSTVSLDFEVWNNPAGGCLLMFRLKNLPL